MSVEGFNRPVSNETLTGVEVEAGDEVVELSGLLRIPLSVPCLVEDGV